MSERATVPALALRARRWRRHVAVADSSGEHTYAELLERSSYWAGVLLGGRADLEEARVALLVPPGFEYVAAQWGIWCAGGVAVPLAISHPVPELADLVADARPEVVVATPELVPRAEQAAGGLEVLSTLERPSAPPAGAVLPDLQPERRAMIVYTSGTTARPKGAVSTHASLTAQITTLVDAWGWSCRDRILHALPLHHVHGIVNALCCPLWVGASCEFHSATDQAGIWDRLASGEITTFMAVPTLYRRLIDVWEAAPPSQQQAWSKGARTLRLMVSGSAALPASILQKWEEITGQRLLERYGMTEIGMALGNPLRGERRAGSVGVPFAGVQARIVDETGRQVEPGEQGEIQVRGPQVFLEYWGKPEESRAAFTPDGWFRTGDEGIVENGNWRIVGRRSTDIIKTGGFKVSALEIEEVLRGEAGVVDVAVIGVEDALWGERVCAAVVTSTAEFDADALLRACRDRLAPYKVPKDIRRVDDLPRNALGKVTKQRLRGLFGVTEPRPRDA